MDKELERALNEHMGREFSSSHAYLSMAAYFEAQDLRGFAHWMEIQSEEERMHAMKFYNFINDRDGRAVIEGIDEPSTNFDSPSDAIAKGLSMERQVSEQIHALFELAQDKGDLPAQRFLDWFIDEQVEEEKLFQDTLADVKRVENEGTGLMMLDRELAVRTLPPADQQDGQA